MKRPTARERCTYTACKEPTSKTLKSRHGYVWGYCQPHHVAAARARIRFDLIPPLFVLRVAS